MKTCEFVSPKHPDKQCDIIADTILDACLSQDPFSRCAPEVMGGHGLVVINGEITTKAEFDLEKLVMDCVGENFKIINNIHKQSHQIAQGVDIGGAGDQGIMVGYATNETSDFLPLEYVLARDLCHKLFDHYGTDGKTQVTVKDGKVLCVVASFQNAKRSELENLTRNYIDSCEYLINPSGDWDLGGFDADTGLSGRKIIIDNYGPEISVGGGSFSGKDWTKVDRSGAYMARRIAVDYLKKFGADNVLVKLAYAIGKREPVMSVALVDDVYRDIDDYDLSPIGIRDFLRLQTPIFAETAKWGHFGRSFEWR